jgi:hypothetical protein
MRPPILPAVGYLDACNFVGLRLAKTISACVESFCSGIGYVPSDGVMVPNTIEGTERQRVSCVEAENLADRILTSSTVTGDEEVHARKRSRRTAAFPSHELKEITDKLFPDICERVKKLLWNNEPIPRYMHQTLGDIDSTLLKLLVSESEGDWLRIKEYITSSIGYRELIEVGSALVQQTVLVPHSVDVLTGKTAQVIHFLLDIFSVLGVPPAFVFTDAVFYSTSQNLFANPVTYRLRHGGEVGSSLATAFAMSPRQLVMVAQAMSLFASNHPRVPTSLVSIFLRFISTRTVGSESTAESIMMAQLHREVCPKIAEILQRSPPGLGSNTKEGVSLIHHCRDQVPLFRLIDASIALSVEGPIRPLVTLQETGETIARALYASDIPLLGGVSFRSSVGPGVKHFVVTDVIVIYKELHSPFIRKSDGVFVLKSATKFSSRTEFEKTMTGLGKAIGLGVLYQVPFSELLRIDQILLTAIHRSVDYGALREALRLPQKDLRTVERITKAMDDWAFEPIWYIRKGIREILGPAGVFAISNREWDALANPDEEILTQIDDEIDDDTALTDS